MKIQTGSYRDYGGDQGNLSVTVEGNCPCDGFFTQFHSGSVSLEKHGWFNINQIVLEQCFNDLTDIKVQNKEADAWAGTVVVKRNGEEVPLFCDGCGGSPFDKKIVVDGNSDGRDSAPTYCLNGKMCTLTLKG